MENTSGGSLFKKMEEEGFFDEDKVAFTVY